MVHEAQSPNLGYFSYVRVTFITIMKYPRQTTSTYEEKRIIYTIVLADKILVGAGGREALNGKSPHLSVHSIHRLLIAGSAL